MSLWTKLFRKRPTAPVRNARTKPAINRFRPLLGELEDRSVPSADLFADATPLTGALVTVTGDNIGSSAEAGEPAHAGSAAMSSAWWQWTAPSSGRVEVNTNGSAIDTRIGVYTGSDVAALSLVQENDDYYDLQSSVAFDAVAGTTYRIAVDGYMGEQGAITLNVGMDAANDNFANAEVLSGVSVSASGHNLAATTEKYEPNHANGEPLNTVWWTWTPASDGEVVINTSGSDFDTLMAVYTGSALNGLTLVAQNDDSSFPTNIQSQVSFLAEAGTTYHIAVGGFMQWTGRIQLNLEQDAAPPPPANSAPVIGDQSFSVNENSAAGTAVGTVAASDPDAGQTLSYAIVTSGSPFVIDSATGAIRVASGASLDFESNATYQVTVQVSDNGDPALSSQATITINLNNVNEAPASVVPGAQTGSQNVPLAINGISVSDPDGDSLTVRLSVGSGTLSVTSVTGGASISGNGTASVVLSGSAAQINAVLGGVSYLGGAGSKTLSVVTSDGGITVTKSVAINVLSVQQQAQNLTNAVNALKASRSLSNGEANSLLNKIDLKGNNGDAGRIQCFIGKVNDLVSSGSLTAAEAAPLLAMANSLLAGL
jgi:hypothetical protein